ncbi:hypothetical protein VTO73DRAFT_4279 [Trametes versicolor]
MNFDTREFDGRRSPSSTQTSRWLRTAASRLDVDRVHLSLSSGNGPNVYHLRGGRPDGPLEQLHVKDYQETVDY